MKEYAENKTEDQSMEVPQRSVPLFYIFPVLYVISIYLIPFWAAMEESDIIVKNPLFFPVLFGVLNIIVSVLFCKPQYRIMLLNASVCVKYAMIPFFLIGGLGVLTSFLLSFIPVPFMIFIGPMFAISGAVGGWCILALESPYVLSYLRLAAREKLYSGKMAVLLGLLQFFFTLDVVDVIFLSFRERKWRRLTIVVLLLLVIAVILLFVLVAMGLLSVLLDS